MSSSESSTNQYLPQKITIKTYFILNSLVHAVHKMKFNDIIFFILFMVLAKVCKTHDIIFKFQTANFECQLN